MDFSKLMEQIEAWMPQYRFLDNSVFQWLSALVIFVVAAVALRLVLRTVVYRADQWAQRTRTTWDDSFVEALRATKFWFLLAVAFWCATLVLTLPPRPHQIIQSAVIVVLLLQAALWGNVLLQFLLTQVIKLRGEDDAAARTTLSALRFLGQLVIWSVVLLLAMDNLGIDVTALVAGLGIGGIAVALAAQNILGDLFASLAIVLDQPFVLGDFIIVDDMMGTVEKVGIKTTRIRSLSGEQLVFANTDLLKSRVRNYKRMRERRVVFNIGVTYQTPYDKLSNVPKMIREAIESQEQTRFDRSHFKEYGDFALVFETVYYVLTADYNAYMDIQQAINLQLFQQFESQEIEFAYPTQTVLLQQSAG